MTRLLMKSPKAPTRSGYTFTGWTTVDADDEEVNFSGSYTPSMGELVSGVKLTANWKKKPDPTKAPEPTKAPTAEPTKAPNAEPTKAPSAPEPTKTPNTSDNNQNTVIPSKLPNLPEGRQAPFPFSSAARAVSAGPWDTCSVSFHSYSHLIQSAGGHRRRSSLPTARFSNPRSQLGQAYMKSAKMTVETA